MNHPHDEGTTEVHSTALSEGSMPWAGSSLGDLLDLLSNRQEGGPGAPESANRMSIGLRRVRAGQHLMHAGAPSGFLYFVRTGTFKIARTDEEGYEQVLAFAERGELLGYDALCMKRHPSGAVALEDGTVFGIGRSELADVCRQVPAFDRELHKAASLALSKTNDLLDIMAAVSSEVRLARFLLRHSNQLATRGLSPRRFVLRMGRRDLASLLGVAHETVSRSFTTLASNRLLQVNDRHIEILDMEGLHSFSRSTRRPADDLSAFRERHSTTTRQSQARTFTLGRRPQA